MDIEKLEKRKEEIIGFQKDIEQKLNQIVQANAKLRQDYQALLEQAKINAGALGEINGFIEAIKKNEKDENIIEEIKVDKKKKRS